MIHHFIINPTAGKGSKQSTLINKIHNVCEDMNINYTIHVSEYSGHATKITKSICNKNVNARIYSCGGDGTLGEVCMGMGTGVMHNIELGCIPCGSGNDFIRNFSDVDFYNINKQICGTSKQIDMMEVSINGKNIYSINAVSVGFDSEVGMRMSKYKNIPFISGSMSYILAIIFSLTKLRGLNIDIELDGHLIEGCYLLCMCGNGGFYGGGFHGAPLARLDDGLLDIVTVNDISIVKIPKLIGLYQKGAHRDKDMPELKNIISSYKSSNLTIKSDNILPITVDGEGFYSKEISIKIIPNALRFILPI